MAFSRITPARPRFFRAAEGYHGGAVHKLHRPPGKQGGHGGLYNSGIVGNTRVLWGIAALGCPLGKMGLASPGSCCRGW